MSRSECFFPQIVHRGINLRIFYKNLTARGPGLDVRIFKIDPRTERVKYL